MPKDKRAVWVVERATPPDWIGVAGFFFPTPARTLWRNVRKRSNDEKYRVTKYVPESLTTETKA